MARGDGALEAIRQFLAADAAIKSWVGTRVFGVDLPPAENDSMPRAAVVVSRAGGGVLGTAFQRYGDIKVDVDCYGVDGAEADALYEDLESAMEELSGALHNEVRLQWAKPVMRGRSGRDPRSGWPMVISTWQVLAVK